MSVPRDYTERVYAGVLGKIIGVYLGRPVEGWSYDRIRAELGEVNYYVHEKRNVPLIVADDDLSGTFTFLRALPDYGNSRDLTPAQIGQTWRNYIIEKKTILWWGGLGNSTEHTAFLRLKHGIPAPASGSIALNGKVVAEQIGAQIFIDGWGMVAPGDPALAADFARRAASVSHDGEAIYAAQVVAAIEAQAFVENDLQTLLDTAVAFIPKDCLLYRMIGDIRAWHSAESDWRKTREQIVAHYGYDKYGGNCHVIPNHGLILHALLHGEGDFQKSLTIVNTCGWDTDCNSGNVGCILGIRNGLAGIDDGPDWRGPVADRLFLPTADGGRCVTDAVSEAVRIVNIGRALAGEEPIAPKNGARFHFMLPGSVQGFTPEGSVEARGVAQVENVASPRAEGSRRLAIRYRHLATGRAARVTTPTFLRPEALPITGYALVASPTLVSGQTVRAAVAADAESSRAVTCRLILQVYNAQDRLTRLEGPDTTLGAGQTGELSWRVPDTGGQPIAAVGLEITSDRRADGTLTLDYLTWEGAPDVTLGPPPDSSVGDAAGGAGMHRGGSVWRRAWVEGVDRVDCWGQTYRLGQDEGRGLLIQGCREWTDYRVSVAVTPHLAKSVGVAARVQGMQRYYALLLTNGPDGDTDRPGDNGRKARLVKAMDGETILAEADFSWTFGDRYMLRLEVAGDRCRASIDGRLLFDLQDTARPLTEGAIALVCEEGRMDAEAVRIQPTEPGA